MRSSWVRHKTQRTEGLTEKLYRYVTYMDKFLQTIAYGNIFIAEVEIKKSKIKALTIPFVWKRYIDVISSLSHTNRHVVNQFIEQTNKHHPIIPFHSWNICFRSYIRKQHLLRGWKIQQGVSSRHEDPLQTNRDIPVHILHKVSRTGTKERQPNPALCYNTILFSNFKPQRNP